MPRSKAPVSKRWPGIWPCQGWCDNRQSLLQPLNKSQRAEIDDALAAGFENRPLRRPYSSFRPIACRFFRYPGAARTRDPLILVVGNIWIIIQLVLDVEASSRASEKPSSEYDGPAIPNHDLAQGPRLTSGLVQVIW